MIELRNGVPIPDSHGGKCTRGTTELSDLYRAMEVGQCLAIPLSDPRARYAAAQARMSCTQFKLDRKFITRARDGERLVWRVS